MPIHVCVSPFCEEDFLKNNSRHGRLAYVNGGTLADCCVVSPACGVALVALAELKRYNRSGKYRCGRWSVFV